MYGCSASNIRRLISAGSLKPVAPGPPYILRRKDVEELSQANREKREYSRPKGQRAELEKEGGLL